MNKPKYYSASLLLPNYYIVYFKQIISYILSCLSEYLLKSPSQIHLSSMDPAESQLKLSTKPNFNSTLNQLILMDNNNIQLIALISRNKSVFA